MLLASPGIFRRAKEKAAMAQQQGKDWGDLAKINVGRQTGSLEWRRIRGELGESKGPAAESDSTR